MELSRAEMYDRIVDYSEGKASRMVDGKHRITPLFRVRSLGEDVERVYFEEILNLRVV